MRGPGKIFAFPFLTGLVFLAGCQDYRPCPRELTRCRAVCVDLASNHENCGRCGNACDDSSACVYGECVTGGECAYQHQGFIDCGGDCVDPESDEANCGACGVECGNDRECLGGKCECVDGLADCAGTCVNTGVDPENCGSCGHACDAGIQACQSSVCIDTDQDDDGHAGEKWGGDDCDDRHAAVHPGADEICNLIDDNCDGRVDEMPDAGASCDDGNECTEEGCEFGTCTETNVDGIACDDGSDCTIKERCQAGECKGEPRDADGDGYGTAACGGDDCDDSNRAVHPGQQEDSGIKFVCSDGLDNDCDGLTDHEEPGCCVPDCLGAECGAGGCPDQPVVCGVCPGGSWCDGGSCRELSSELVWIEMPGGTFMMGSDEGYSDEQPVHQVSVPSFYMTMSEVTVEQYTACVDAGVCGEPKPYQTCPGSFYRPGYEDYPMTCMTWDQAATFCEWAGGRLPSEAEWEYAARGGGADINYPWGNQRPSCDLAVMDPGCFEGECCPSGCDDRDGDGYGRGSGCAGPDCNDSDATCNSGTCCLDCIDFDGDGYGMGVGCIDEDCDDGNPRYNQPCYGMCVDLDLDGYGRFSYCNGPDCNESDPECHRGPCCLTCIDIDGDGYGIGAGCLGSDCTVDERAAQGDEGCWQGGEWPVCSKPAGNTAQGLCDIAGNAMEFTQDFYHEDYVGAPSDGSAWEADPICFPDPTAPDCFLRVARGGSFSFDSMDLRVAFRYFLIQDGFLVDFGFRCARSLEP